MTGVEEGSQQKVSKWVMASGLQAKPRVLANARKARKERLLKISERFGRQLWNGVRD